MYQAIINTLKADSTLQALLPGGIHNNVVEISRQLTPTAFDENKELQPCALVKPGTIRDIPPYANSAAQTVEIFLYQRRGFDVIEQADRRIYQLLHDQRIEPVNEAGSWLVKQTYSNTGLEDGALNCSLGLVRYEALINRLGG